MPVVINLRREMDRFAATLNDLGRRQLPFATAGALNDSAKAAADVVNRNIPGIFSKAIPFTRNAAVAPPSLRARKNNLVAIVTVRPVQAKYLFHEEVGGTRTPAENTRRPDAKAIVLPAPALPLNAYRNIPAGKLARLKAASKQPNKGGTGVFFLPATSPANKAGVGGYFVRDGKGIHRLTGFKATTQYQPKFNFRAHVYAAAFTAFPPAMRARMRQAMATARP